MKLSDQQRGIRLSARASVIKAMSHPARLLIIEELETRERCVQDLTKIIGIDVSTVSKHLAVLRNAGIVQGEKRGSQVYYSLCIPCITKFLDCVEKVLANKAEENAAACSINP
ncbi:MAG TPA: ArsR family transcriptional regulator [Desulfobacterales bacterium]|nr:ArsR family transcriptional regulator [Desulfobacterales bacterium]